MGDKIGEIRQRIFEKRKKASEQVRHYTLPDLVTDRVEKTILAILNEYGVDYPLDFDRPPPDVYVPSRQGTIFLCRQGCTSGGSPPVPLDVKCFTFKAREGGFLVIDTIDIIMEDPIAEGYFTITYTFDEQRNSPNFQCDQSVIEPGHWKFNRVVLADGDCMEVCVRNTNPYAGGYFSLESRMWSL